jgi:hypothetical protein
LPGGNAGLGLDRWIELLKSDGRVVLIEGRWWTGGGLTSEDALTLVQARNREAAVTPWMSQPVGAARSATSDTCW